MIGFGQNSVIRFYENNSSQVFDTDTIIYHGIDFSSFKLVNGKKVGTEDIVKKYFPYWILRLEKYFNSSKFRNRFNLLCGSSGSSILNKKIILKREKINRNFKKLNNDWIVYENDTLSFEIIQDKIRNYDIENYHDKSLGFVIIPESFIKDEEKALVNFVIFNNNSKKILLYGKIKANSGSGGMKKHWGNALVNSLCSFQLNVYRKMSLKNNN